MKRNIEGLTIELEDNLYAEFEEKLGHPVTELDCLAYVQGAFHMKFEQIRNRFSAEEITHAVEDAMREELSL
jgi:ribosome-associated translation inhibitor RaiA